ncbi:MAG: diguanylate cyclase, partial [Poseidonibacter sp.]|uniref:diguanylate cyclase n=1 Tax=Poseidonibacter sp. TaxID=2321188 RepID=UPI00359ECFAF
RILDIATKNVITVTPEDTIQTAVELMYKEKHRDVIILPSKNKHYSIFTANDLIKLKSQNIDFNTQIKEIKFNNISAVLETTSVTEAILNVNPEINCLCVIDNDNILKGFVSYYDLLSSIDPKLMLEKRVIGEIMLSTHLKYANMNIPTLEILGHMDKLSDCIILTDDQNNAKGIITTKDVVKIFGEKRDLTKPISEYMSFPIQTINSTTTISTALEFVQSKHFKRLIVEDFDGEILGQITQEELLARIYSKWADVMRNNDNQLQKINKVLKEKATKYQELSTIDNLTGIFNRLKFEQELKDEIDRIRRYKTEKFSLVILDIDNFKKINDTYGHIEGDNVLKQLVLEIKSHLRSTDIFSRWGGEEFVIILPLTNINNAKIAIENIRKHVSSANFNKVGNVTCSFGLTEFNDEDTFHSVITRADEAMYIAKTSGKNRVEVLNK